MTNADVEQLLYLVSKLQNTLGSAEGSSIPPRQTGDVRVPIITGLRCEQALYDNGGTAFTLTWNDIPSPRKVSYLVYAFLVRSQTDVIPLQEQSCVKSPAVIRVRGRDVGDIIIFKVQTVMQTGIASSLDNSPSCSGVIV